MKDKIKWPTGNRLDLCIPLRKITVTDEGTQFGEYVPSQAAVVMVYFVGNYASYEYTPRIEDNKLFITDNGELKPGVYAIDVRIQEPERKLRSFRCGELEIVRETKQLALGDFVLNNNITLDADAFIFGEGPSAFEVAVRDGYTGTKEEWLESLRGREGRGIADIVALPTGAFRILLTDGSAYVTPILKGEQGVSIVDFTVSSITSQEVLCTITMSDGTTHQLNLPRGEKGEQGDAGEDGRGIQSVVMNNDYTITFSYTDGTSYTTPQALRGEKGENGQDGQDGQDGRGISNMSIDDDNHLTVSYTDGTTYTTPQSLQGERGVSITDFEQVGESATMTFFNIYYSNGNISQIGLPKGEQGDRGEQGPQGPKGDTVVLGEVGEYKLYNVGGTATDGAMTQDATTKAIAAANGYFECGTAAGTAAKVAVGDNEALYTLQKGGSIKVKMTNANAAASGVTLKIGSSAATPLYYNNEPVSASNTWEAGEVISVYYDGNNYQASNSQGGGGKAEKIKYDNSQSGLVAENVQGAVDELNNIKINTKALSLDEYIGTSDLGMVRVRQINANGTITAATGSNRNNYLIRWLKGICSKDDYIEFEGTPNVNRIVRIGFVRNDPDEMTDADLLATVVDNVSELSIAANTTGKIRVKAPYDGYLVYFLVAGSGVWQGPTWTIYRSNIVYDVKNNLEETVPGNPLDAVQGAFLYGKIEKTTQFVNTGYYAIANKGIAANYTIVTVSSAFNIGYIPVKKNQVFKIHYTQSSALNCVLQVAMTSEVPAAGVVVTDFISDQKEEGLVTYTVPYDGYLVFRYRIDSGFMTLFEVLKESVLTEYEDYYEDTNIVHIYTGKIISVDESNLGAEVSVDSSWGWGSSTYLYVKGCKYVKIRIFASGREALMNKGGVFYDADKQPLSVGAVGTIVPHTSGITGHDVDSIIEVPDDAFYFRFTTYTADTVENAVKISTYKYKANSSFDSRKEAIDYILAQAKYVDAVNSVAGTDYVDKESLTLLHFTDIHAETRAAEFIHEVIDALGDKLDDVLCTGDVVYANYKSSSTEDSSAISDAAPYGYVWWQNSGLAEKSLFTIGNHEGNQRSSTSQYHETSPVNDWDYIGKQVECETFIEPYAEGLGITRPDGADDPESPNYKAMYWYKDYPEQKIRLIGIDGIHHYDNVRYTTREQEDWLTATLAATPSDYSVIFACHFGLDDFAGDNSRWDDETHKWVCNENEGGGRVMVDGDNVTKFHDVKSTAYTCNAQMALRVKYIPDGGSYGQRRTTDENPIGDIIQNWIDNGGKCAAWIAGHTHIDYMFYPTKYPSILNIVNNCARSGFETNMSYRPANVKTGTFEDYCANIYVFDTQNGVVKIIRVGKSMDKYLVKKDYLCYDYVNKKVISEG